MLHNQSLLGFSLLVLSCTSPTLGAIMDPSPSLDSVSPPPSPPLGTSDVSFKASNSSSPQQFVQSVPLSKSTQIVLATMSTNSALAAVSTGVPTGTNSSLDVLPLKKATQVPSHISGAHRGKHHSNLAAHFSTQRKLQSQTIGKLVAAATPSSSPLVRPTVAAHVQDVHSVVSSGTAATQRTLLITSSALLGLKPTPSTAIGSLPTTTLFVPATDNSPARLVTSQAMAAPTAHELSEPNPDEHASSPETSTSQTARRTALLAAFLILGALGAIGGGVVCFRCGLLPCCHRKSRRPRCSTYSERTVEEGLRSLQKLAPITMNEKMGTLIPGRPPTAAYDAFYLPILPRNMHAHTLSCSTCPPDSLNGVKGGISGTDPNGFRVYATNDEGEFEDVTHILTPDAMADRRASANSSLAVSSSPRQSVRSIRSANTRTSASGRSDMGRYSTTTVGSASTRLSVFTRASRASEGAGSTTGESYATCDESRYSTPSVAESRERPPSAFARIRFADSSEDEEFHSSAETSGESMSLLLMTPESDYAGLADAALIKDAEEGANAGGGPGAGMSNAASAGTMDMEIDGSDWDVAGAYAYGGPPAMPLPMVPAPKGKHVNVTAVGAIRAGYGIATNYIGKGNAIALASAVGRGKSVKARPQTGVPGGLGKAVPQHNGHANADAVALGGRTCVLMRG